MRNIFRSAFGVLALALCASLASAGEELPPLEFSKLSCTAPPIGSSASAGGGTRGDSAPYRAALSGTLLKSRTVTSTVWLLYPNACNERAAGTWAPRASRVADSLDTYDPLLQSHGYGTVDHSQKEILWHVTDGSDYAPDPTPGLDLIISGTRSLWCGKYDASWVIWSGYPNLTYQILYLDTDMTALAGGAARDPGGTYTLAWQGNINTEYRYDYLFLIGGGDGQTDRDPIGNDRVRLDKVRTDGADGDAELLLAMTGVQLDNHALAYAPGGVMVEGGVESEAVTSWSLSGIPARHRGVYFLFYSDCLFSNEDGLWSLGHGQVLDSIVETDSRGSVMLYDEQEAAGGTDPFGGTILVRVNGQYAIAARVAPGVGGIWSIQAGDILPSADYCQPQKQRFADRMFLGVDPITLMTVPAMDASIETCTLPIPAGAASVLALYDRYLDLPLHSGFFHWFESRVFRDGSWSNWRSHGWLQVGAVKRWGGVSVELPDAVLADSVQLRYRLQCIPALAADGLNCQPTQLGLVVDNLRLEVTTGTPGPSILGISLAQSTFVDGTDPASVGCLPATIAAGRCWPGRRGSDQDSLTPIHDNFNAGGGDVGGMALGSGLRPNGMGINWKYAGEVGDRRLSCVNATSFDPRFDTPRWVYRIFDPATRTWSPWDSSALNPRVSISAADTTVINDGFFYDWPPIDKYYINEGGSDIGPDADADLPGAPGWTLNGKTKYSEVPFLPRGTKIQYYFKAVDIGGGVSYSFGGMAGVAGGSAAFETEELPALPGSGIVAPDISVFSVLPSVYPPGTSGTLLAGRTDARVLYLESDYMVWPELGYDPILRALRGLGVRADRYRWYSASIGGITGLGFPHTFPGPNDYGLRDLLANSYDIIVDNNSFFGEISYFEEDAMLLRDWWAASTGINGGDRCILTAGDAVFNALLNTSKATSPHAERVSLAQNVFGVASCIDAWSGTVTVQYPTIDDRFAGGGPGMAAPGTFTYPIDGGCPATRRFDGLTKIGSSEAQNAATYPGSVPEVAGIARSTEMDASGSADNDRNKALAYAFSMGHIRAAGIPPSASNYVRSGSENVMRVLYKFLTSCRKTTASTTPCWPCPSNAAEMTANWATATGFQTGTYGALYPIQDYTQATGVEVTQAPRVNRLDGNFPNPFNPETAIRFTAATPGKVTVRIFDVAGRLVNTLTKNIAEAGPTEIRWNGKSSDGRDLASGIYFYRIRFANGQQSEAKMAMLK